MRGKWILGAGSAVLAAMAAGALSRLHTGSSTPNPAASRVAAASLQGPQDLSLTGKIEAQHTVTVAASTEGRLSSVLAEVGQEVFEGQVLAQINNTELQTDQANAASDAGQAQARLSTLEASLLQARLDSDRTAADASRTRGEADRLLKIYERQQLLVHEGATPRLVFEKAEREYKAALAEADSLVEVAKQAPDRVATLTAEIDGARRQVEAKNSELERVKAEMAASEVRSPVTGVVVARRGEPGEEVDGERKDLFQIATDLSQMKIVVEPKAADLGRIHPGLAAVVRISENGNEPMPALVREIRTGRVTIEFQNPNPAVKPGLTAQVQIKPT